MQEFDSDVEKGEQKKNVLDKEQANKIRVGKKDIKKNNNNNAGNYGLTAKKEHESVEMRCHAGLSNKRGKVDRRKNASTCDLKKGKLKKSSVKHQIETGSAYSGWLCLFAASQLPLKQKSEFLIPFFHKMAPCSSSSGADC